MPVVNVGTFRVHSSSIYGIYAFLYDIFVLNAIKMEETHVLSFWYGSF